LVVRLPDMVGCRLDWVAVVMALVGGWHGKGGLWCMVGGGWWVVWWHCVALLLPVRHLGSSSGSLPAGGGRRGGQEVVVSVGRITVTVETFALL